MVQESEAYVRSAMAASEHEHALIFCGSGATGAIKRLQEVIGVAISPLLRSYVLRSLNCMTTIHHHDHHHHHHHHHQSMATQQQQQQQHRRIHGCCTSADIATAQDHQDHHHAYLVAPLAEYSGASSTDDTDGNIDMIPRRWVVFTGPYEHHSNLLSWRQSLAEVCIYNSSTLNLKA
jgi:selenocysteine lyase/cysteine desulfurase